nr:immunoglobulin light chain junction region [Macaca mulatta]
CMIWHNNGYIF